MMSQLLHRLSKLSSRSNGLLMHKRVRWFSSSRSPYLTLCIAGEDSPVESGDYKGDVLLFNAAKEELVTVRDKIIPKEIVNWKLIGATKGWGVFSDRCNHNSICISDLFSPKSTTKIISLPQLTTMLCGQTQVVWNVAMSHQDNEEEDCVVAINFLGRQLSMCRPCRDVGWTNKLIPISYSLENSNLMFSKRDQRFYLPAPGGNCLCSWDLNLGDNDPKFHELVFQNLPELPHSVWELLDSCFRENHWVESPSGECFLVRWYSNVPSLRFKEPILMVFREDREDSEEGKRIMCYTEDIGDVCIFLSNSEPFCVVASSCPGLKPNSIYMMGRCFAVCDLAAGTTRHFKHPIGAPEKIPFIPYWLPPLSI